MQNLAEACFHDGYIIKGDALVSLRRVRETIMELLSGVKRTALTYFSNHDPGVDSVPHTGLGC